MDRKAPGEVREGMESVSLEERQGAGEAGVRFGELLGMLRKAGVTETSGGWKVEIEEGAVTFQHSADKGKPGFTRYAVDEEGIIRGSAGATREELLSKEPRPVPPYERQGLIGSLEAMVIRSNQENQLNGLH